MSKLDKAKEYIGTLKVYMGILAAVVMAVVSGTVKLFNAGTIETTFWVGILSIFVLSFLFVKLVKHAHNKIDELEDL